MGISFFQNSGGAGVRIHLSGKMPPLLLYPLGARRYLLELPADLCTGRHQGSNLPAGTIAEASS